VTEGLVRPLRVRTGVGGGRSRVRSLVERYGGGVEESYGGTHGLEGLSRGGGRRGTSSSERSDQTQIPLTKRKSGLEMWMFYDYPRQICYSIRDGKLLFV